MPHKVFLLRRRLLGTAALLTLLALVGTGAYYHLHQGQSTAQESADNPLLIPDSAAQRVSLVIYQKGRAFIEDTRRFSLPAGRSDISFGAVPETMIVSSAHISGAFLEMQTQNFNPVTEDQTYYARVQDNAIGGKVRLLWSVWKDGNLHEIKKEATLLAVERGRPVLLIDGFVHFGTDAQILYPNNPSGAEKKDKTLSFTVETQTTEPQDMTLSYLAEGFSWRTDYAVYLDEAQNTLDITGFVTLNNTGSVDYKNAHIDFVLGDLDTVYQPQPLSPSPYLCEVDQSSGVKVANTRATINGREEGTSFIDYANEQLATDVIPDIEARPMALATKARALGSAPVLEAAMAQDAGAQGREARFSSSINTTTADIQELKDYYVYRLPFTVNLLSNQPVQALFMHQTGLTYHKEYTFNNPLILNGLGERRNIPSQIHLLFANKKDGEDMPLPQGLYRIFNRRGGQSFFVGEDQTYTTTGRGDEIQLSLGKALDVFVDVIGTSYQKEEESLNPVSLSDFETQLGYTMIYRNLSDETKTLVVRQDIKEQQGYRLLESSIKPHRQTPEQTEWRMTLGGHEQAELKIRLQYTDLPNLRRYREAELAKDKLAAEEARLAAEKERLRLQLGREGSDRLNH